MADCIFCRIVAGELPSSLVFRDEACAAFMDIQPVNSGHVLVVPLRHAAHLADLDALTAGHLMIVTQRIAAALRATSLRCEGVNLLVADGDAAGQEVFHVHVHVIPRYTGDGFGFRFGPEYTNLPPREQLSPLPYKFEPCSGARPLSNARMATIAIGDVRGNSAALDEPASQLKIEVRPGDVVMFLGDDHANAEGPRCDTAAVARQLPS